jgi:hypothetical protein
MLFDASALGLRIVWWSPGHIGRFAQTKSCLFAGSTLGGERPALKH